MDPFIIAALASTAANVGGSLLGNWLAGADEKKRQALEDEAYRLYGDISAPTLERVLAEKLGPSAMEGLPKDFGQKNLRNIALQRMVEEGMSGGMSPESQLELERGRRAASLQEQQGRGAVRQEMQRRGLRGAGEAVGQLVAQQQGADRASLAGVENAANARSRALGMLAQGGAMAGQAEDQDFRQAAQVADARDRIAQFNANLANQAKYYNAGLGQQNFQNQMSVADRKYQAKMGQADSYGRRAEKKRQMVGGIGQSAGYLGGAIGQNMAAQQRPLQGPPRKAQGEDDERWW